MDRTPYAATDRGAPAQAIDATTMPAFTSVAAAHGPPHRRGIGVKTAHMLALLLASAWPTAASASWTLDFGVGGYCIEMEVGDDAAPAVGRVRYFAPGDKTGIALRPQDVRVDAFDVDQRRLHLEHRGSDAGAPAFDLRVEGDRGVLDIGGKRLPAAFDWQM